MRLNKLLRSVGLILAAAVSALAVQQTNRLGLYLPAIGSPNYGASRSNTNFQIFGFHS